MSRTQLFVLRAQPRQRFLELFEILRVAHSVIVTKSFAPETWPGRVVRWPEMHAGWIAQARQVGMRGGSLQSAA